MSNVTGWLSGQAEGATAGPALAGIRVVDMSTTKAGAIATHLLAELGADVVRLEGSSDASVPTPGARIWNRSKRILTVDNAASDDLHALIGRADVVVHDDGGGAGLPAPFVVDSASLGEIYPDLVVAGISGYPNGHPDESRVGTELLVLARLGALDDQEGVRPGPVFIRYPFATWGAAYLLTSGIMVRLFERERTGRAKSIQTSLLQGALVPAALYWQRAEHPPEWMVAHTLPKIDNPAHISIFECSDGRWIQVLGGFTKTETVRVYLDQIGRGDLLGSRVVRENRPDWASVFAGRPSQVWLDGLWSEDIACMPVLDPGEVFGLEQSQANGYAVAVTDPALGATMQASSPITIDPPAEVRGTFGAPIDASELEQLWTRRHENQHSEPPETSKRPPLAGLRVVDFGAFVAGPLSAQCFADFGADVIKVEPIAGEKGRNINQFTGCQRGKRSLAMDLRNADAREIVRRLIASADVVTHNMRSTAARKLGIDDGSLRAINPRVVIATSTGYGEKGPWAGLPAYDPTALALSGVERMITGPLGRPTFLRNSSMDSQTGLALFTAAMVALYLRERTGRGTKVATSLLAVAAMASAETPLVDGVPLGMDQVDALQTGISWRTRLYRTVDGWLAVDAVTDEQSRTLLTVLRCQTPDQLEEAIRIRASNDVLSVLDAAGVPAEIAVEDGRDRFFDLELAHGTGLVERMASSPFGWFENPGGYWSDGNGVIREAADLPRIGEHNQSILTELGFGADEIDQFTSSGVVGAPT